MLVRLINSDNPEIDDLMDRKGELTETKETATFHDVAFRIVDRTETEKSITFDSPYFFYKFTKIVS